MAFSNLVALSAVFTCIIVYVSVSTTTLPDRNYYYLYFTNEDTEVMQLVNGKTGIHRFTCYEHILFSLHCEREHMCMQVSRGGAEREREGENPKQAPSCQRRTHKPRNHDLSRNQELDAPPTEPPRCPIHAFLTRQVLLGTYCVPGPMSLTLGVRP